MSDDFLATSNKIKGSSECSWFSVTSADIYYGSEVVERILSDAVRSSSSVGAKKHSSSPALKLNPFDSVQNIQQGKKCYD